MALAIPTHIGNSDTTSDVSWPAWPSPPLPPQGGASKRLSDLNSLLRDLSRRVVRVEIGHKPGVFRGTGGSNPVPSSGEIGHKPGVFRGTGGSNPVPSSAESAANLTSSFDDQQAPTSGGAFRRTSPF